MKKLSEFSCKKCGFSEQNSIREQFSDTDMTGSDNILNSPIRMNHMSRTSSYSLFIGTLTLLGTITLLCIAMHLYSTENQMGKINIFTQLNETRISSLECKNINSFFKEEREKWKEKSM